MQIKTEACRAKNYYITSQDLPLTCPMPEMKIWNAHPKQSIHINKDGIGSCSYCSATYQLKK